MSTTAIAIRNEDEAWSYLKQALEGGYENDVVELSFDCWPRLQVNVIGERYNSTLTAAMMRAMIDLQAHLNRVYAEAIYGKSAKSLTNEERTAIEVLFKVEQGSSQIGADLAGFFAELGKNAMEKMTGKQVIVLVLGAAAMWTGSSSYNSYLGNAQKTKEEQNRHEMSMALIANQPKLLTIQNETLATYNGILKSVPDAEQVTLGTTVISRQQLETITKSERQTSELSRLDDLYKITGFKVRPDSYKIELTRISDETTINTQLFRGHLNIVEMEKITKAAAAETAIKLNVIGRIRKDDNAIVSANIIGVNDNANGQDVATTTPQGQALSDSDQDDIQGYESEE